MLRIFSTNPHSAPWEARLALLGVLFVIMFALANSGTQCARADASCQVGETAQFSSAITVNEDGNDADSRFEGDTEANLTYWDAGNNRVGIGTATPAGLFDVNGALTATTIDGVIGSVTPAAGTFAAMVATSGSFTDGNITNVGSISLDSVTSDAGAAITMNPTTDSLFANGTGAVIGHTSQVTIENNLMEFEILGTGFPDSGMAVAHWSDTGTTHPTFMFFRGQGSTIGATPAAGTAVVDNDGLARFIFNGDDGVTAGRTITAAQITVAVDGTVSSGTVPGRFVFETQLSGGATTEALRIDSAQDSTFSGDILASADSTHDIGKTGVRFANLWSDLINGADYGYENGWRMLESDTYAGYGPGIAIDFGEHFEPGKALAVRQVDKGKTQQVKVSEDFAGNPIFETRPLLERERVTNVPRTPVFAVTADFIEFQGVRITLQDWTALAALAAAN